MTPPTPEDRDPNPSEGDLADEPDAEGVASTARVAVLPDALSNQIAAGEVVERPASVVKELVENALDAGASRILIDIEAAGRGLIRIVDDGTGMVRDDAALAVLRHATSKVRTAADLEAIGTLGFRGEALPSIASVSRFLLVTRTAADEAATTVRIEGGSPPTLGVAAAPIGTRIEVRDLFWNVPARLKFLKTDATETQHVVDLVKGFALGHPRIHFRLGTGGKSPALDFPAVRKLSERVAQVLGREVASHLYEVHTPGPPVRVTGFVSGPRAARATPSAMTCFVNGRRVRDRVLHHAAVSAFGDLLSAGRFPQAILWVHLDPADVDVNVHPAKAEVRFRRPDDVHSAVATAIQGMLRARPWADDDPLPLESLARGDASPPSSAPTPGAPSRAQSQLALGPTPRVREPEALYAARPQPRPIAASAAEGPSGSGTPRPASAAPPPREPAHTTALRFGDRPRALFDEPRPASRPIAPVAPPVAAKAADGPPNSASPPAAPSPQQRTAPAPASARSQPFRVVGSMSSQGGLAGLMLLEDELGLVLVDVVAAIELITAARILALPAPVTPQPLLIPARLELAPHEAAALQPRIPDLQALGIWVEPFGGTTHQILGLPAPALRASPARLFAAVAKTLTREPGAERDKLARACGAALASSGSGEALIALVSPTTEAFVAEALTAIGKDQRGRRPWVRVAATELLRRLEGG